MSIAFALLLVARVVAAQPSPGTVLWSYDLGSLITGSPALAPDGTLYIGTVTGLSAITNNGNTAGVKWSFSGSQGGDPAMAADGTVYFSGLNLNLYALNSDGVLKWVFPFRQIPATCPAIGRDGTVYVSGDGIIYALTPAGAQKWAYTIFSNGIGSPVIGTDETIYIGSGGGGGFFAFSPDGALKWAEGSLGTIGDSPAIGGGGTLYLIDGRLMAFTLDGANLWASTYNQLYPCSPVIGRNGAIYAKSLDNQRLYAMSTTGQVLWSALPDNAWKYSPPTTPVIGANDMIYYLGSNGVYAVTTQGQVEWCFIVPNNPRPSTSPSMGPDGTLYAGLGQTLYAIASGTTGLADSPWPMYRQNPQHNGRVKRPFLKPGRKCSDGSFEFQLYGEFGKTVTVESSTNLMNWTALTNILPNVLPMPVVDHDASNSGTKFYRAF